jgi:hypothetical protein
MPELITEMIGGEPYQFSNRQVRTMPLTAR